MIPYKTRCLTDDLERKRSTNHGHIHSRTATQLCLLYFHNFWLLATFGDSGKSLENSGV